MSALSVGCRPLTGMPRPVQWCSTLTPGRYFGYLRRPAAVHMGPVVLYCTVAPSDATSPSQRTRARRRYRLRALACRRARHDMQAWRVRRTEQQANGVGTQMRASGESHLSSGRCGANDGARRAPSLPVAASRGVPCQCRPTARPQRGVASAWSAVWAARCMRSQVGEG